MQNLDHHQKTEKPNEGTPSGKGEGQAPKIYPQWVVVENAGTENESHKSDTSKREILARIDLWQVREAVHFCAKEGCVMSIRWRLGAVARGLRPRFVAIDLSRSC